MRMADQVDLAGTRDGENVFDLGEQLFAPHFSAVGCRNLGHEDAGASLLQGAGDAIKVVEPPKRVLAASL